MRNAKRDQIDAQYPIGVVAYYGGDTPGKSVIFKIAPYRYILVNVTMGTAEGIYAAWNLIEHFRAKYDPAVPPEIGKRAAEILKANQPRIEAEFNAQGK